MLCCCMCVCVRVRKGGRREAVCLLCWNVCYWYTSAKSGALNARARLCCCVRARRCQHQFAVVHIAAGVCCSLPHTRFLVGLAAAAAATAAASASSASRQRRSSCAPHITHTHTVSAHDGCNVLTTHHHSSRVAGGRRTCLTLVVQRAQQLALQVRHVIHATRRVQRLRVFAQCDNATTGA